MLIGQVKKLKPTKIFEYWVRERWIIHVRKNSQEGLRFKKPLTDDEILGNYRFCNVLRNHDRVSQWLINNWYLPNRGHRNMLLACAIARLFNTPSTLISLGFPTRWQPEKMRSALRYRADIGMQIFNPAYLVVGGIKATTSKTRWEFVLDNILTNLVAHQIQPDTTSIRETHRRLMEMNGIGSFLAGQIAADARIAIEGQWLDRMRWAPVGPGSARGINRLLSRPLNTRVSQSRFDTELRELMEHCGRRLINDHTEMPLEAMDYQNCLCEFDKYCRVLLDGRPLKRKFIYT
jgi:hypothetical protein